jgi:hypothetical protein
MATHRGERKTENIVERNEHRTLNIGLASQDFGKSNDLRKIEVSENHSLYEYTEAGLHQHPSLLLPEFDFAIASEELFKGV